jgi:large subunit ribosomal protein L13
MDTKKKTQHVIDASGQTLGRLATQIAALLQGKNTPAYNPRFISGNVVVVKNASKVKVSGNKDTQKVYYKHTGYMGHLKEKPYKDQFAKDPRRVIEYAVFNMLPKNWIRQDRMNNLKIER